MMHQLRQWGHNARRLTGTVLFPDPCIGCGRHVSRAGGLCPDCWQNIDFIDNPCCAITGAPFSHDFGDNIVSAEAIANPPDYDRARAVCVHDAIGRDLVTSLKYGNRLDVAPAMAGWMVRAGAELIDQADIVVPVPLHRFRLWQRRYNQSAELARAIARKTDLPLADQALIRRKHTKPQVGLTAAQRKTNVAGVFKVPQHAKIMVAGRSVLIVDDVLTTGATINAAARALKKAGAEQVLVLTFSRVVSGFRARGR